MTLPSSLPVVPGLLLAAAFELAPAAVAAQGFEMPTEAEWTARATDAETAPLFWSDAPLQATLRTRIATLRDERDTEEVEGTLSYVAPGGDTVTVPVRVRPRGNFRRDRRNCRFPPLRLNFPRSRMEGTLFHGQDRMKLVTPCHESRDDYQQFVVQEYLVYRTFALLTPRSFRTRLLEITYVDTDEEHDPLTRYAFLIESDEQMADRNRAFELEVSQVHPAGLRPDEAGLVDVFQYMIGNTDWSGIFLHNAVALQTPSGRALVPYDFDWAGAVSARYARPAEALGIRNVRERVFRGFCRPELADPALRTRFLEVRDAVTELYETTPLLEDDQRERVLEYYEEFWETVEDEDRFEDRIVRRCREMPG